MNTFNLTAVKPDTPYIKKSNQLWKMQCVKE